MIYAKQIRGIIVLVIYMYFKYLNKVENINDLNKISYLFDDIRFYMGKSVLDGMMGTAYVDNLENPKFAILIVRSYCFISGQIDKNILKEILYELKNYKFIPDDMNKFIIKELFKDNINESERYSFYKKMNFDIDKLKHYINKLDNIYRIVEIDKNIAKKINESKFINITDNYEESGIGCCCTINGEIIGVASSNIIYSDGIEVNIKVNDNFRKKGIATALAAYLIIMCIDRNLKISWDAANLISVKLAKKIGFKYYGPYNIYTLNS